MLYDGAAATGRAGGTGGLRETRHPPKLVGFDPTVGRSVERPGNVCDLQPVLVNESPGLVLAFPDRSRDTSRPIAHRQARTPLRYLHEPPRDRAMEVRSSAARPASAVVIRGR